MKANKKTASTEAKKQKIIKEIFKINQRICEQESDNEQLSTKVEKINPQMDKGINEKVKQYC